MRSDALFQHAIALQQSGDLEGAQKAYKRLLSKEPRHALALCNLALLFLRIGDLEASDQMFERAILFAPKNLDISTRYMRAVLEKSRYDKVPAIAEKILAVESDNFSALFNAGLALACIARHAEAEPYLRKASALRPADTGAMLTLAKCLFTLGQYREEVLALADRLAGTDPKDAETLGFLGTAYYSGGQVIKGVHFLTAALSLGNDTDHLSNLGNAYLMLGDLDAGITCLAHAAEREPTSLVLRSNLLFALNYDQKLAAEEIYAEYRQFNALIETIVPGQFSHENRPARGDRRIRIGFSSPDFRHHAAMHFVEPLIHALDRERFETFAFYNNKAVDAVTERLRGAFDHWRDIRDLSDKAFAEMVVGEGIDILIDLAGHSQGNRLLAFALKPAPVQVSYLGYGYTTGLEAMDYFLGDETLAPIGCESLFSEAIHRLNGPIFCYAPPADAPEVSALPAVRNGYITFGSLSRVIRMNDEVLATWAELLRRVPNSRLRLDQPLFGDAASRAVFAEKLERLGLPMERVDLVASKPHWPSYHEIDITLDCWPHTIGTTAIESLYMGVPVLTKIDRPSVGRVAGVFNRAVGLEDWIVETREAYLGTAIRASGDLAALADLRAGLRQRVLASPLLDHAGFAHRFGLAMTTLLDRFETNRNG